MEKAGVQSDGPCSVPGKLLSKQRMHGIIINPLRWYMEDDVFSFVDTDCHPVALKPIRQLCDLCANPSENAL
jgi:hypothetical protein